MATKPERVGQESDLLAAVQQRTGEQGQPEYRFHPTRRWRLDLAWPSLMVGVEIQGALFVHGKHVTGVGAAADHEKLNEAQLMGWIVIQIQPRALTDPATVDMIVRAIDRQREQLADWMLDDTVTLAADPSANKRAGAQADSTF